MAWYEVTNKARNIPFVVGEIEKHHYEQRPEYEVVPLGRFTDVRHLDGEDPSDRDTLAEAIDHNVWDTELHDDDKDFSRESALMVLKQFHVFLKEPSDGG